MGLENKLKILIIDDDSVDRQVLKQCLYEAADFHADVHEAASGREGIERSLWLNPDCVLLDYRLPDLDGIEVVRELSSRCEGCAIVMLTAVGNERVAVEAMKAGVQEYASKDTASPETLQHIVRNAVDRSRMQRQIEDQRAAIEQRNRDLEEAIRRESLARSEAESSRLEYRLLVETIPQMVWRSTNAGEITFSNGRWTNFTGSKEPGSTHNWLDIVHPDDRPAIVERWSGAMEACGHLEAECQLLRRDGQHRWHLISGVPPSSCHGGTWLFTATDITDQREAQQGLLQKQKLDSIGLLAGGVAHDFNNLLVGIMGSASFALDVVARNHPAYPMLKLIVEASERAAHLTRQLLAYAGKGQFTLEPIQLSQVVLHTRDLVQSFVPKTVHVQLDLDPALPEFQSDPGQVEQVVMNLIINAAEAIGPERHGLIGVRTCVENVAGLNPPLDASGAKVSAGTYIVLEVRDTGCGIPDDIRSKIFDPFFTTKFTGRGLGLAAVLGIVRSNRGAIQVSSTPGKGTSFRVLWPAAVFVSHPPPPEKSLPLSGNGTVLVIDDEKMVCNIAEVGLSRVGYQVLCVERAARGLELIQTHPEIIAVLLDMNMPEMSGPEALARIVELRPELPVIVCSGFSEAEVRRQFASSALAGVIQKPFTTQKLANAVSTLLSAHAGAAASNAKQ
jgi:PAS domain S-box-containing protein